MTIEKIFILHGGELSADVAAQIESKIKTSTAAINNNKNVIVRLISMSKPKDFKVALHLGGEEQQQQQQQQEEDSTATDGAATLAIFVVQTIENESPPEEASACIRFLQRKTHPNTLLPSSSSSSSAVQFTVLGLGDSNLLLDRQHTSAKDCNAVAQRLDVRLEELGGTRFWNRGEADERTGLTEVVEPWIQGLVTMLTRTNA